MKSITPFLWFDTQAQEAAEFYVSLFPKSKILSISHYQEESAEVSGKKAGSVMSVNFKLNGQEFVALNGGPQFSFSQATSFLVPCESQGEIDRLWARLSRDGQEQPCGWVTDAFGLTWQIVPARLNELLSDSDAEKAGRVMSAMLKMQKMDIATLESAYRGDVT
jgi:predicted 3-demethylubiquinone-9 3-methyltransferase (glyoxalase superfamily)